MSTAAVSKTDFIKFNVSPTFKVLAEKKARAHGMTLSELGRMLFGAFVSDLIAPSPPKELTELAEKAKENYRKGIGRSFGNADDAITYLHSLNK